MAKTYTNPDPKRNNTGIEVTFENGKPKIIIEAFNDDAKSKVILARTNDGIYTLWADGAYDSIGDWTTQQAIDKVRELALAGKKK
jgi:hypothetical protein